MRNYGEHNSGLMNYGGKGYCVTHYETVYKYGEDALDAALEDAVEAYWRNRVYVRAGIEVPVDRT